MKHFSPKTVLVVEDDANVRHFVALCLSEHGYQTLEAEDGRIGLERFEHDPEKIDLVLTDVNMPRMTGPDMVRAILKGHPPARILFMSGTAGAFDLPHGNKVNLLRKPFTAKQLTTTVHNCLQ